MIFEHLYHLYKVVIPARVRGWLRPVINSPATLRSFTLYAIIGALTAAVDLGSFKLLVARVMLPIATSVAFTCGATVQFNLNKFLNFKNHERSTASQATSYVLVAIVMWPITVAVVQCGVTVLHLAPLTAKALTIPLTAVVGYVLSREVIFGPGARALFRRWARRQ